jgi:rare lipoprotein A
LLIRIANILIVCLLCALPARAQEKGIASFYHDYFAGRVTASGERYDPNKLTAAHKSLPIGTLIKVTNLENDRSVIVRINDRGPYVRGRMLDLSKAAAVQLGLVKTGFGRVAYELIESDLVQIKDTMDEELPDNRFYVVNAVDTAVRMGYGVKLGSFDDPKLAFIVTKDLRAKYNALAYIQTVKLIKGNLYRIFVGNYISQDEAGQLQQSLKKSYPDCRVVSYDNFK